MEKEYKVYQEDKEKVESISAFAESEAAEIYAERESLPSGSAVYVINEAGKTTKVRVERSEVVMYFGYEE